MSSVSEFACMFCGGPIDQKRRLSARFCSQKCRNQKQNLIRRQESLANRNNAESVLGQNQLWLMQFNRDLLRHAPPEAGGYQAGLSIGEEVYWFPWFPERATFRNTLLHTRSYDRFFLLRPFEPPWVPLDTHYRIRFIHKSAPHSEIPSIPGAEWSLRIPFGVRVPGFPLSLKSIPRIIQ